MIQVSSKIINVISDAACGASQEHKTLHGAQKTHDGASETASMGKKLWKGEREGTVFKTLAALVAASLDLYLLPNLYREASHRNWKSSTRRKGTLKEGGRQIMIGRDEIS